MLQTTVNPFVPNVPFFYPLNTSENLTGVEEGYIWNEWVNAKVYFLSLFSSSTPLLQNKFKKISFHSNDFQYYIPFQT